MPHRERNRPVRGEWATGPWIGKSREATASKGRQLPPSYFALERHLRFRRRPRLGGRLANPGRLRPAPGEAVIAQEGPAFLELRVRLRQLHRARLADLGPHRGDKRRFFRDRDWPLRAIRLALQGRALELLDRPE